MKVSFKTLYPDGSHSSHLGEVESIRSEIIREQFWYSFNCNITIQRSGDSAHFNTDDPTVIITAKYLRTFLRIFLYRFEGKVRCKLAELLHLPMLLYPLFIAHEFWVDNETSDDKEEWDDPEDWNDLEDWDDLYICSGEFRNNFLTYINNVSTDEKMVMAASGSDSNLPILPRLYRFADY